MPVKQNFDLEVFIDSPLKYLGKYQIQLLYQDIYANHYEQNILLEIMADRYKIDLDAGQVYHSTYEGV